MLLVILFAMAGCASQPAPVPPPQGPPPIAAQPAAKPDEGRPRTAPDAAAPRAGAQQAAGAPWDVDLRRDEERGGHAIARHVGRTDAQLMARLQRESISAASTYVDLETAERVVALALAANARRVQHWIDQRSPKSNLAIRYRARDGLPTGRLLRRGADESRDVTGAVVVLRWRGDDWYVLTTYPEDAR